MSIKIDLRKQRGKKLKYLITGGAGFIGSHLSEFLLENGHNVTVIDNLSTGRKKNIQHLIDNNNFRVVYDTIDNLQVIDRLASETDFIVHLAAAVGVKLIVEKPVNTIKTNIRGTEIILENAARYDVPVFIASSSEVYGKLDNCPFSEEDDCHYGPTTKARWSYAVSKAVDEYLGLAYYKEKNLKVIIGRFFNTIGPRQVGHYGMVLPRFITAALKNEDLLVYGDGKQSRCFGYVKDAVKAIYLLIKNELSYGEIINIGNNKEISIGDLAEKVISACNSQSNIKIVTYEEIYGKGFEDMQRRIPDTTKLENLTEFRFQTPIDEIIHITSDHIQKEELL